MRDERAPQIYFGMLATSPEGRRVGLGIERGAFALGQAVEYRGHFGEDLIIIGGAIVSHFQRSKMRDER